MMSSGLEGVIVAETVLSHTDSERGMVWMRGHDLPGLVANHGFEGTVALLWDGFAGEALTRAALTEAFGAARVAAFAGLGGWLDRARDRPLLEGMRSGLAFLPDSVTPFELIGAMTVMVPALLRSNNGMALIEPDPALSTPADLLRMWHGAAADPAMVAALDTYFTVMAESGLNGSSFTARIVASTRASLAAAVLGAWCAFTGPLHGGAPGPTLDMLDAAEAAPDLAGGETALGRTADGFRPSCVSRQRSSSGGDAVRAHSNGSDFWAVGIRVTRRGTRRRGRRTREARAATTTECGDHGGAFARRGGISARGVHAGVRRGTMRGVDRARIGAKEDRSADPSVIEICRRGGLTDGAPHRTAAAR
jgi:hypothetical protein